jgi:hypothetical protein
VWLFVLPLQGQPRPRCVADHSHDCAARSREFLKSRLFARSAALFLTYLCTSSVGLVCVTLKCCGVMPGLGGGDADEKKAGEKGEKGEHKDKEKGHGKKKAPKEVRKSCGCPAAGASIG